MKSVTLSFALLLLCLINVNHIAAQAPIAGGEISYVHVSGSNHQFYVKLFVTCNGTAAPDSLPLCFYDTCNNNTFSIKIGQVGTPKRIEHGCQNIKNSCDSIGSLITGHKEYYYASQPMSLPQKCSNWRIATYVANRDTSENIVNSTSQPLYLEATFNNTISDTNSAPIYTSDGVFYTIQSRPFSRSIGAIDADGDSLSTQLVWPQTDVAQCTDTAKDVSRPVVSPIFNLNSNPFQTNNSFVLNRMTGMMAFSASSNLLGHSSLAMVTKEYRNGQLIGSAMREMRITTLPKGTTPAPGITLSCNNGSIQYSSGSLNPLIVCSKENLSVCFKLVDSSGVGKLSVSDNHSVAIPNANISYAGQGTDTVTVMMNWTPNSNQVGFAHILFTVSDTGCYYPGIPLYYSLPMNFSVIGDIDVTDDTAICPNGVITLNPTGGDDYEWEVIQGDTNSLIYKLFPFATVSPDSTTTYVVTSRISTHCNNIKTKDTVTVTVLPQTAVTTPSIKISVSPDSNIVGGTTVTFTAAADSCTDPQYQWTRNGSDLLGETGSSITSNNFFNNDIITCKVHCAACASPKDTVSNAITIRHKVVGVVDINKQDIWLYPNPNKGQFTIKMNKQTDASVEVINTLGQMIYRDNMDNKSEKTIQLSNLAQGIYMVRVATEQATSTVRFTVK